jgi:hypothetical protein
VRAVREAVPRWTHERPTERSCTQRWGSAPRQSLTRFHQARTDRASRTEEEEVEGIRRRAGAPERALLVAKEERKFKNVNKLSDDWELYQLSVRCPLMGVAVR